MTQDPSHSPPMVPALRVEPSIRVVRGHRVLVDADLALLYEVDTRILVQSIRRNVDRFPADFMFRLTSAEATILRSQIVISRGHGGRRHLPYAFTEQGVAMLSSVLRSRRAILVNIEIMRAFVRMREAMASHGTLARKLDALETKCDGQFRVVFDAIRRLMAVPGRARGRIGFRPGNLP